MKARSAAARTVSLFTGLTDLESADARDGTPAAYLAEIVPAPGHLHALAWARCYSTMREWESSKGHRIYVEDDGTYRLSWGADVLGHYPNICDAADAAECHHVPHVHEGVMNHDG